MFQKIVQRLLNKILGEYVQDFKSQNLKIGLWNGDVVLNNVKIKKQIMKKFNLPFKIKYSNLRCLKMNIPWSSLASSKIQVLIQGLELLITQIHPSLWQLKNQKIIQLRKQQIKAYCQSIINDFALKAQQQQNSKNQQDQGYFSGLVVKIIDNLQVTIKDIHIRYEDQITKEYSFGMSLEQLKIFTVDASDQPIYIDRTKKQFKNQPLRKRLILSNFGIYWNQKSIFFEEDKIGQRLKQTIPKRDHSQTNGMNYIILMSFQARLLQRQKGQQFKDPEIDFFLDFDQLKIQINNKQLQQIVNMTERLQQFSTQVKRKNKVKMTKQQLENNVRLFQQIFPQFYKNQAGMSSQSKLQLEDMLQKIQVDQLKPVIKKYLQDKQKQRIIQQKKDKSRGWFTGPKQITEDQQKEIQKFLDENFGKQVKQVTRPKDFYYTRINLRVKILQFVIANSQNNRKQGIRLSLQSIGMQFKLRQTGYWLQFGINDVFINLFQKLQGFPEQQKVFLKKLISEQESKRSRQYVRLIVEGSPIDKPHMDTYIKLVTEELLIFFDPKIIKIATNFANVKINAENSSAALEKYGQIKQKTTKSVNQSLESKKKSFIYIDIRLKAITAILYFDPTDPKDIWAITLGQTRIYTDQETLKNLQDRPDKATQRYSLQLNKISFCYYQNQTIFLKKKLASQFQNEQKLQNLFKDLNIDITLQIFRESTISIPKIRLIAQMNQFQANLTAFTYKNVLKVGECFLDKQANQLKVEQKSQQKSQVMKNARKIGFIFLQDNSVTKTWKKYVGVLSDNYLYLYNDKRDINYAAYYYVRNSTIKQKIQESAQGKKYVIQLKNKVNAGNFGFQKKDLMQSWIDVINKCTDKDQDIILNSMLMSNIEKKGSQVQSQTKIEQQKNDTDPNLLNFQIGIKIQAIGIKTYLTQQKQKPQIVEIQLTSLDCVVYLHQKKTVINLSLLSIDLSDNILTYKWKNLKKFLYTQRTTVDDKLVDIKITQINQNHPEYQYTDNQIYVSFGKLICNYKAQTVVAVMKFFIPSSEEKVQKKLDQTKHLQLSQENISSKYGIISTIFLNQKMQKFSMKVHLKMAQISIKLINTKNLVFFAQLSMQKFEMMFGMSDIRMVLTGGLQQLSLKDYSNYPNTIIQEKENYQKFKYILTSQRRKKKHQDNQNQIPHLIFFDVNMLNKPNDQGKKMIIQAQITDLEVSYIQQPVLRLITYLNTQFLPSLNPQTADDRRSNKKPEDIEKSKFQKQAQMKKKDQLSQQKPQMNTMDLKVLVYNINVVIQPRNQLNEQLKLNIQQISVKNSSIYRPYIKSKQNVVLVQNYNIKLVDMSMFVSYVHPKKGNKMSYKLTPDIDFKLSVDLIQNPIYYQKTYGKQFLDGMRITTWMSDFFMRINHDDYNFLMKCLNWNVTYDDNAEKYLYDLPEQSPQQKKRQIPPLYFNMKIQSISLFIIQENLPLAFLLIDTMNFQFIKSGYGSMKIDLSIQDLIGSSLVHKDNGISIQRGMFNSFAYQKEFKTQQLKDLDKLLQKFQRKNQLKQKSDKPPVISFLMQTDQDTNTFMGVKIQQLKIAVEMNTLLILSQLAVLQEHIKPPKPLLQAPMTQEQKQLKKKQQKQLAENKKPTTGKTQIYIQLKDFLASLTDTEKQNFFIMDGQVCCKMLNYPVIEENKIIELSKKTKKQRFLQNANHTFEIKNFSIYFCNIHDMSNKRYILKPFTIICKLQKYYESIIPDQSIKHVNQLSQSSRDYKDRGHKEAKQIKKAQNLNDYLGKSQVIILLTDIQCFIDNLIFETSISDLLKINQIAQDNLKNMNKYNQNAKKIQKKIQQKTEEIKQKVQQKTEQMKKDKIEEQKLLEERAKTQNKVKKIILDKMKARVNLCPISFLVINDCNQNFMPVIRFILQQSRPTFESDILKAHLSLRLLFNLNFFNPRSSKWEPVIQNYGATVDYLNLIGQKRNITKIIIANIQIQQLKQLKINFSTQFIASLMSTLQISKEQQKNMISNGEKIEKKQQIQVSPYIFQNITNKQITIKRTFAKKQSDIVLKSMFKGTVRLTEDAQNLHFSIGDKKFKISLQHYGIIKIADSSYYIEFKVEKLNRVIRFLSNTIIQNQLAKILYVKRFFRTGQVDDIEMEKKEMLALDGVKQIQISMNKVSYTDKAQISIIQGSNQSLALTAINKKFLLWLTKKTHPNNFTVIQIWPPLLIYNCLPKQFTIQFLMNGGFQTKDILAQHVHETTANVDFFSLKYKISVPGFFWSPDFFMKQDEIGKQMYLQLSDRSNGTTTINYIFDKTKRGYSLIIYCKSFLVSELQDDILAYGNLHKDQIEQKIQKYYVLGGQRQKSQKHDDDIVIIGSQYGTKLRICGDGCPIDFSQPFSLGGIGMTQNRRIVIKRQYNGKRMDLFTTIGIDVSIKQMFKNLQIFTKMVKIHSRAIIFNKTDKKFTMRQQGCSKQIFSVQKNQRKNLYFTLPQNLKRPRGMVFTTQNSSPSNPVNISQLGTCYFKIMNKQSQLQQYYKIHIHEVSKYIFYEISQLNEDSIPYQIQNRMPHSKVLLKFNGVQLSQGQKFDFINQHFTDERKIKIRITHEYSTQQKDITVTPDDLNFKHKQSFDVIIGGMKGTIHADVRVNFDDKKKYIVIDEVSHRIAQQTTDQQQFQVSSIHLRLQKIVFSFIQNHISIQRPYQSFSLFLTDLQFINEQTNIESRYQVRLRYLQFDQDEPFNIPNPVIITPYRMKQFMRQQNPKSIFNALVSMNKTFKQNTFINKIQIQFNDLVVKISQYFIDVVMQMTKQFYQVYNYKEQDYLVKRQVDKWNQVQIPKQGAKTFIKHIAIAPFVLEVSAQIKLDKLDTQSFLFFGTILNALGVVITNIQGAPITLQGKQLKDCVDTLAGINQKLLSHYKNSVIKQFYKIFGSLNIIGNPMGFFRNISTGIKDLKQKPSQGFIQGPLQFGKGIAQGTSSLIAHSIGGALNSVSKVTGTISSGLAVLAFDKQFEELREKQKVQKPQHIFEGLQKGGKAVFYGFRQGIKGVFLQPYQNTKKQGAVGFFKGTAKGLAGLFVKPITGVIDFASKTTEGLKNTALYLQDKPNENRMRYPRVFYTQCCTVKQYDSIDSKLNAIIKKVKYDELYQNSFFVQSYKCDNTRYLLILQDKIILIKIDQQKIQWALNIKGLKLMHNVKNKQLNMTDGVQYAFKKNDFALRIQDNTVRQKIINQIDIIHKEYL